MVEYLYDAIKAVAGQEIVVNAFIADEDENPITEGCSFMLHDSVNGEIIASAPGVYLPEEVMWEFRLPAEATLGLSGRHWYCIQHKMNNLCFKQPIYLM